MGGRYQSQTKQSTCTDCAAGKYSDAPAATDCKACAAGTFLDTTGATAATECKACPFGKRAAEPAGGAGHSKKDEACLACNTKNQQHAAISVGKEGIAKDAIFKAICDGIGSTFDGAGEVCSCAPGSRGIALPIATGVGGFALGFGSKYALDRFQSVGTLAVLLTMLLAAAAGVLALRQRRRQQLASQVELHKQDIRSA